MAEPKAKAPVMGKSVLEIAAKYATGRLRPTTLANGEGLAVGGGSLAGGIRTQLDSMREEIQASRLQRLMTDQAEAELEVDKSEMDARKMETEVKTLEAKSRLQELREKLGEGSGQNPMATMMFAMMEMLQDSNNRVADRASAPQDSATTEVLRMVLEQNQAIRDEIRDKRNRNGDDDPMETLTKQMGTLIQLKEMMSGLTPTPATGAAFSAANADLTTTIRIQEMEMAHQVRMAELAQSQERWKSELTLKEREIQSEENRSKALADGLKNLAGALQPVVAELAQRATGAMTRAPEIYPSAVPENVMPMRQYAAVAGGERAVGMAYEPEVTSSSQAECPNCREKFDYPEDKSQASIQCPSCGAEWGIDWSAD